MTALLCLDTTHGTTSFALWDEGRVQSTFQDPQANQQSSRLVSQLQQFIQAHGLPWHELGGIACTTGPGGFTSVRVGVATTRALSFAASVPAYGLSVMEVMAWYALTHAKLRSICTILPAGRAECSWQHFRLRGGVIEATSEMQRSSNELLSLHAAGVPICCPQIIEARIAELKVASWFPMEEAAEHLAGAIHSKGVYQCDVPEPLYARPPDATPPKPLLSHG